MRIGSLFAGYSGLDAAVQLVFPQAHPVWFVEFDEAPSKVLSHHYPDVPNYGDVTQCDWASMPPIDILTGGYPCQPFSQAGQRKGTRDERHLWPAVRDAIRHLQPRYAFLENVVGHLTLGFDQVLADLASIGWDAEWTTLRASEIGAPHHRDRLFILAYPHGQRPQAQRLPGGQETQKPRDYHRDSPLWFLDRITELDLNLEQHARGRGGDAWKAILTWALVVGEPPPATTTHVKYHDPTLWGDRFPLHKEGINPELVEWMMGLPAGWVTSPEIGLTRNQQLKALGNGVVPQQAATAFTQLLTETNQQCSYTMTTSKISSATRCPKRN